MVSENAGVVQLVERLLAKQKVTGSNPVARSRTRFKRPRGMPPREGWLLGFSVFTLSLVRGLFACIGGGDIIVSSAGHVPRARQL
jgi:hypothetical protein